MEGEQEGGGAGEGGQGGRGREGRTGTCFPDKLECATNYEIVFGFSF